MSTKLDSVVPFGRTLEEYSSFFMLSEDDFGKRILGVGDGPASFNAEASSRGAKVVSLDPLYEFGAEGVKARFEAVVDGIVAQIRATPDDWVWSFHKSPDDLRRRRELAMALFAADFDAGRREGRYVAGSLPSLPFADGAFDLVLCSHLLFLYSEQLSLDFHIASMREMLRIAPELRVFPLKTLMLEDSPHVEPALAALRREGFDAELVKVPYEFQKGGDTMLRAVRPSGA